MSTSEDGAQASSNMATELAHPFTRKVFESLSKQKTRKTKRRGRRLLGALGLLAGTVGTTLLIRRRSRREVKDNRTAYDHLTRDSGDRWARPGMEVTFRAELMPGRSRAERTFRVERLLPSGRVTLEDFTGEHAEAEFVPLRF